MPHLLPLLRNSHNPIIIIYMYLLPSKSLVISMIMIINTSFYIYYKKYKITHQNIHIKTHYQNYLKENSKEKIISNSPHFSIKLTHKSSKTTKILLIPNNLYHILVSSSLMHYIMSVLSMITSSEIIWNGLENAHIGPNSPPLPHLV